MKEELWSNELDGVSSETQGMIGTKELSIGGGSSGISEFGGMDEWPNVVTNGFTGV